MLSLLNSGYFRCAGAPLPLLLLLLCGPRAVAAESAREAESQLLILFLFLGTFLGAITTQVLTRYAPGVPYTVVVFIEGLILAALCDNFDLGHLKESVDAWSKIDSELIFFIFLPVLVFGEAMSLKWHHVTGGFVQSLLLAGPGVIMGAFLMATFVMYVLPLGWSWSLALVFGAITSATDTVAVVAVMKNAGASAKLTILIIGESLLNDGCAMVMFALFMDLLRGESYDFGGVVVYFIKEISISVLIGVAFGLASVWLLSKANRSLTKDDTTIQIAITFCTAYLVFFVAEFECEVSGVLACCVAGYMLAWKAPPLILEPETMHHVWGMIEWAANTVIFMLAGLIIGKETVNNVHAIDWFYLFVLYIVLIIIRAIVVAVLYPFLSTIGLKCTWRDAVFISWAGLRGALAVSLALIVQHDKEADVSSGDGHRVLFFVGGIAALTFFINAVFASNILDYLGLLTTETSPDKVLVLKQVQKRLRKKSFDLVMQLAKEMNIEDPASVVKHNSLLKSYIKSSDVREPHVTESMRSVSNGSRMSETGDKTSYKKRAYFNHYGFETTDPKNLKSPLADGIAARAMSRASDWLLNMRRASTEPVMTGLQAYVRTVFLEIVRVHYWKCIEGGKLPRESYATQTLLYSIEKTLDKVTEHPLCDWEFLLAVMENEKKIEEYMSYLNWLPYARKFGDAMTSRNQKRAVYILTNFIEAHETAQVKILSFMGHNVGGEGEHGEGLATSASSQRLTLTPEEKMVIAESKEQVVQAHRLLETIDKDIVASVQSKQAALVLLTKQAEFVTDMIHEGLLTEKDGDVFFEKFRDDEVEIRKERRKDIVMYIDAARIKDQATEDEESISHQDIGLRARLINIKEDGAYR